MFSNPLSFVLGYITLLSKVYEFILIYLGTFFQSNLWRSFWIQLSKLVFAWSIFSNQFNFYNTFVLHVLSLNIKKCKNNERLQTSGNNLIPFNRDCPQNLGTDRVKSMNNLNCSKVKQDSFFHDLAVNFNHK